MSEANMGSPPFFGIIESSGRKNSSGSNGRVLIIEVSVVLVGGKLYAVDAVGFDLVVKRCVFDAEQ